MNAKVTPLVCPNCGSSTVVEQGSLQFGLKFQCSSCQSTSVLVIDSRLETIRSDELVCVECGRVAKAGARFCQCGASTSAPCQNCGALVARSNSVCDQCGWPVAVVRTSTDGKALALSRAVQNLRSTSPSKARSRAIFEIANFASKSEHVEELFTFFRSQPRGDEDRNRALHALGSLLPLSEQMLRKLVREELDVMDKDDIRALVNGIRQGVADDVLCVVAARGIAKEYLFDEPGPDAYFILSSCGETGISHLMDLLKSESTREKAAAALVRVGRPAVTALKLHTGLFSSSPIKRQASWILDQIKQRGR